METKILRNDDNSIIEAVKLLKNGEVIAFPTDTVYGICADAFCYDAIEKIYEIKNREKDKPLIVMVPQGYDLNLLVENFAENAKKLINKFWPGALTIIFKSKNTISKNACKNTDTLGIRIPDNECAIKLLNSYSGPLVTTSANISHEENCITSQEVYKSLNGKIPIILDGGKCTKKIPSTIISLVDNQIKLLRQGNITMEEIEKTLI